MAGVRCARITLAYPGWAIVSRWRTSVRRHGSTSSALPSRSPARMAAASCVSSAKPRSFSAAVTSPAVWSSSSRSTIRNTFAATRAWKDTCPSVASRAHRCRGSRRRPRQVRRRSAARTTSSSSGPPPSSRSSTSHSVSLTRRPIAANSTDGVCPDRWRSAWNRQMTPQRKVATVSHHRNASRSTAGARGLLVGGQEALDAAEAARAERLRCAEPPGADAEPGQVLVDLADVDEFPVQHGGQTGLVDDQVAHPEIAVHEPRRGRRWPVGGQPPKRPLERRRGVAHLVEPVAPLGQLLGLCQADPVRVGAVDGGQRLGALPQQPVAARRRRGRDGCA